MKRFFNLLLFILTVMVMSIPYASVAVEPPDVDVGFVVASSDDNPVLGDINLNSPTDIPSSPDDTWPGAGEKANLPTVAHIIEPLRWFYGDTKARLCLAGELYDSKVFSIGYWLPSYSKASRWV